MIKFRFSMSHFLVLTSQRLLENNSRLEGTIAQNKIAQQAAGAAS